MVKSLKAALVLSLVVISGLAFAGPNPTTALVSYLETSEGLAKFSALMSSGEKLVQIQNFIRVSGISQAEIRKALDATGAARADRFRKLMEEAVTRAASDPVLGARVVKVAQEMLGVTDAQLTRVASLELQKGNAAATRANLIRKTPEMPGGKFGPPIPDGPLATPVRANANEALLERLAQVEKDAGRPLSPAFVSAIRKGLGGEGFFDACSELEAAPRHVLQDEIAAGDAVPETLAPTAYDIAVTEAAIKVNMERTFRDREEAIDSIEVQGNGCGYLGPPLVRGVALIRAGVI